MDRAESLLLLSIEGRSILWPLYSPRAVLYLVFETWMAILQIFQNMQALPSAVCRYLTRGLSS